MKSLSIDIETYGSVDLTKSGVYAYANAPDFKILLFAYAFDDEEVKIIDLAQGEALPKEVMNALTDENILKTAYNANFERTCIGKYFNINLPVNQWRCSAVQASELGLPLSLSAVAVALGLEEQKDKRGKALIDYFSKPCKPTKTNGGRTRNLPMHAPDKWEVFKEYCIQDVEVERAIKKKLAQFPICDSEQKLWTYDQQINDRGVRVDRNFVENAIKFNTEYSDRCYDEAQKITGLENPKSVVQLKAWLEEETGQKIDSLNKEKLKELIADESISLKAKRVIYLRSMMAKTSVTKYEAMERSVCDDGRIRGLLQFYGANRSGRWAGRLIQLQNLPQNHIPDLKQARELVKSGNYEAMELLYDDIPDTLSQLIRTAFIPKSGMKFVVSDFSAIEARVLSWLADEKWRLDAFKSGGDIYCASASQMFRVPVEKHGVNGHLRQKGKIAELALGYGGSVGALKAMGALEMGLSEDELQPLVDMWRSSNPNIVRFWWEVDRCVKDTIRQRLRTDTHGIQFEYQSGMLFITLPSGRRLSYVKPRIGENKFGGESVTYEGVGATKKWERIESYGPKFVENIVQAVSRDILCYTMRTLRNYRICGHVHDELIIECPIDTKVSEICDMMGRTPPWAEWLPLRADGYETEFYKKD